MSFRSLTIRREPHHSWLSKVFPELSGSVKRRFTISATPLWPEAAGSSPCSNAFTYFPIRARKLDPLLEYIFRKEGNCAFIFDKAWTTELSVMSGKGKRAMARVTKHVTIKTHRFLCPLPACDRKVSKTSRARAYFASEASVTSNANEEFKSCKPKFTLQSLTCR